MLVAVFLIGLLAFISLAVDGGRALAERRDARNAADHAAMNAAWADCNGGNPQAAADDSVDKNGYDTANLTLTSLGSGKYRARIDTSLGTGFAGVVGIDQLDVSGTAVAECTTSSSTGGTVNAAFWSWTWINITGQDTRDITGGFYANGGGNRTQLADGSVQEDSNGCAASRCQGNPIYDGTGRPSGYHIRNSGQDPRNIDKVACTVAGCSGGPEPLHQGTPGDVLTITAPATSFPLQLEFDDYLPTGAKGTSFWCGVASSSDTNTSCNAGTSSDGQAGTYNYYDEGGTGTRSFGCPSPGVYVVNGNLRITGQECGKSNYRNVTLIAQGWINITGSDPYLEAYDKARDGVVMFSESVAAPYEPVGSSPAVTSAIRLTGQDPHIRGAVVAPYGNFGEGGQDLRDSSGVVVAESISSGGQDLRRFNFDPSYLPPTTGTPSLRLLQ